MKILLLGAPGSGKGTQARRLSEHLGDIPAISTGEIFRKHVREKTELGVKIAADMAAGNYLADDIVLQVVDGRLREDDCSGGFILDGFPRTIPQAEWLQEKYKLDHVILIDVQPEVVIERISNRRNCDCGAMYHVINQPPQKEGICDNCGKDLFIRDDDKEDVVRKRLQVYTDQTEPLIQFYDQGHTLHCVEGRYSADKIFDEMLQILAVDNKQMG